MPYRIAVVTAGLSQPSTTRLLADRLAESAVRAIADRFDTAEVDVVDLRTLATDIASATVSGGVLRPALAAARDTIANADAVIAVTPVFRASYSGLFKSFFDLLDDDALCGVPMVIGATAGTERHQLVLDVAMRPLFSYLRAIVVPTGVFAATDDFGSPEASAALGARIERAGTELADLLTASGGAAARPTARFSGADVRTPTVGFEDLLRGHTG